MHVRGHRSSAAWAHTHSSTHTRTQMPPEAALASCVYSSPTILHSLRPPCVCFFFSLSFLRVSGDSHQSHLITSFHTITHTCLYHIHFLWTFLSDAASRTSDSIHRNILPPRWFKVNIKLKNIDRVFLFSRPMQWLRRVVLGLSIMLRITRILFDFDSIQYWSKCFDIDSVSSRTTNTIHYQHQMILLAISY